MSLCALPTYAVKVPSGRTHDCEGTSQMLLVRSAVREATDHPHLILT